MNVKRQTFEKGNKENSNQNLASQYFTQVNKNKPNIGEEVRKKLKIKNNPNESQSVLLIKNDNHTQDELINNDKYQHYQRQNFMHRSIKMDRSTSRTAKSVKFDVKNDNKNITRKHSTTSILKNGRSVRKQGFSDKMSMNNSVCSNILKDDQSTQNLSFNKAFKQKYQRTCQQLKKCQKKYADQLFPPIWSSLCRILNPAYKQIEWMRLSQIFSGKFLTVWDYNQNVKITPGQFSCNYMLSNCLNSIKYNNFMLEKMFESQKFNIHGIYYVKISQNNTWKYLLIDDYIPVFRHEKKISPAFLNVHCSNPNHMQIWPFLLQKAYAKYYSNYECLQLGNEVDLLQEITGCFPEGKITNSPEFQQICYEANNCDSILIAQGYNNKFYPIVPRKPVLTCEDPDLGYVEKCFSPEEFKQCFQKVYCISLHKYFYSGFCTVKYNHRSENDNQISLRCIILEEPTQCVISLVQKDAKHYYLGDYKYIWVRVIVVMKESQKNYRWIAGVYGNTKYANLSLSLQPAEYTIIIMPEWRNKGYDLNLIFHGNHKIKIDRKPYQGNQNILIQSAMDLAQSKGKLKQLNPSICTYSYIEQNVGFIIENINNERPNGFVRILRSIEGLQQFGENLIRAFNVQFKDTNTIQVKIDSLQHFTVLLGVLGGINKAFLDQFDFGS